jgi:hypothetical protein
MRTIKTTTSIKDGDEDEPVKISLFATCPAEKGKPAPYAPKIHFL